MYKTPFYLIDEEKLENNLNKIYYLKKKSNVKVLLALKCFATWSTFSIIKKYLDGTTSSSLYEVRLGNEKFGKETHAYSVAYKEDEIEEVVSYSDKIIFNSINQLLLFNKYTKKNNTGLRINPNLSYSNFLIADPAREYSRLGEFNLTNIEGIINLVSGFMIHNNCENDNYEIFDEMLSIIEEKFSHLFKKLKWLSLGGGISFTNEGYPLEKLASRLKNFINKYDIELFLEPGEAVITNSASLEVSVLDIVSNNDKKIAIVDSSIEAHMLDLLIYRERAKVSPPKNKSNNYSYMVCGKSCLAGDIFGEFDFDKELVIGDKISFIDAAGYTMVKKNWFNGLNMPSIIIRRKNGELDLIKEFSYFDYMNSLS